jgi:four helix bundle protein
MKSENPVRDKSYLFAVSIVKLYQQLKDQNEFELARQILRSGTSVGANIEEAIGAQSDKDFFTKITIAYKEARETKYWLRLLTDTGYLTKEKASLLLRDNEELLKLLGTIQKTLKLRNS